MAQRAAWESDSSIKRKVDALADPDIVPVFSVSLGDVRAGLTPAGGIAVKVAQESDTAGFKAGVELRPGEPPRWGVRWSWRF